MIIGAQNGLSQLIWNYWGKEWIILANEELLEQRRDY